MRKIQPPAAPEIVYGSASPKESVAISREVRAGRLRRIGPKLYTTKLKDSPESIIRRHLYRILAHYYLGAVVSHHSALEGGAARDDTIFLACKYTKRVTLPGTRSGCLRARAR